MSEAGKVLSDERHRRWLACLEAGVTLDAVPVSGMASC